MERSDVFRGSLRGGRAPLWRRLLDAVVAADGRFRDRCRVDCLDARMRRDVGLPERWDPPHHWR